MGFIYADVTAIIPQAHYGGREGIPKPIVKLKVLDALQARGKTAERSWEPTK